MNVTNAPSAAASSPALSDRAVPSIRPPRFDVYGPIHKAMRMVMSDLLVRMGKTTFANEARAIGIANELEELLAFCDEHIEHETRFIHPHLAARLPNALAKIDEGHDEHERLVTELRGLINGVRSAQTPELRVLAGHTLYLHYTTFFAETLAHMVEEERVLQPLMYRFFTDEELLAMNGAIIASLPPEKLLHSLCTMIPALNGPERAGMLAGVQAGAPPQAFQALIGALRPRLDADEWTELLALCPFIG